MILRTLVWCGATLATTTHAFQLTKPPQLTPQRVASARPSLTYFPIFYANKELQSTIETLLESGNIDGAVSELRQQQTAGADIAPSSYHAIIEACCSGGGGGNTKGNPKSGTNPMHSKDNDRLDMASTLLDSMGENVTPHSYEILISGYARRNQWAHASKLLVKMEEIFASGDDSTTAGRKDAEPLPSLNTYQTVLTSFANGGQYDRMMSLLTKMRRRGMRPTVYTYNSLMNICAQEKPSRWKEALSLLSQCQREPGINPDLVTYTTAMR
jgi:pentatricopeptide repeat protein